MITNHFVALEEPSHKTRNHFGILLRETLVDDEDIGDHQEIDARG